MNNLLWFLLWSCRLICIHFIVDVQKNYITFMTDMVKNKGNKRYAASFLNETLRNVKSETDLRIACKMFHNYAARYFSFNAETSRLMMEKFIEYGHEDAFKQSMVMI